MSSLNLLAIKPKTWRDLISDEPFKRSDIVTIQDPNNLAARDLREYDYVKKDKKVTDDDMAGDPLKGINVDAAGGASKVLRMLAEKVIPRFTPVSEFRLMSPRRERTRHRRQQLHRRRKRESS